MLARAAVGTVLLSTTTFITFRIDTPLRIYPFIFIGLLFLLTILYSLLLDRVRNLVLFGLSQIFVDLLLISVVLVVSGGSSSPFSVLYAISIVCGSILFDRTGGYLVASLSCLCLLGLIGLEHFGLLSSPALVAPERSSYELSVELSQLFLNCFGFFLIGHLSGHLAERLRHSNELLDQSQRILEVQSTNLLKLQHFNRHLLQSIHSGIVTTDVNGIIQSANRPAIDLLSYKKQAFFGHSIFNLFPSLEAHSLAQLSQENLSLDISMETQQGDQRVIELLPNNFSDLSGKPEGMILVLRDVTELRRLQALEREADKLAALGELAATIAHEIRNPLASMRGSIELLSKELLLSGTNRRLMDIVLRESARLGTLVHDFLSYARQPPPELVVVDLASLLQEMVLLLKNNDACRTIQLELELHAREIPALIDPKQIHQVLWNLAHNALKAMGGKGVLSLGTREVVLREDLEQGGVCLWVKDTGCGIPATELGQLLKTPKEKKGWAENLGLAIVKKIITAHHGEIELESKPGGGTTVLIYLPALPEQELKAWTSTAKLKL